MEEYEYMYEAIRKGDIKEVENFVAKASKEDINSVIKFYSNYDEGRYLLYSPLSTAVMYNQLEIAELLLKNGADPDTIGPDNNYDMNSVLNCAILNNNTSMVKLLLDYNVSNLNRDYLLYHPLESAVDRREADFNSDIVKLLLEKGADVNYQDICGNSLLMLAAQAKGKGGIQYEKVIESLLAYGINVDLQNNDGETALMYFAENGDKKQVEALLSENANVLLEDQLGLTAICYAECDDIRKQLEKAAFFQAADKGDLSWLKFLIADGIDVNALDANNDTALIHASSAGKYEAVEFLLSEKAAVNFAGQRGYSALHCAAANGDAKIADLLIEYGAIIDAPSKDGVTPLMEAAINGKTETVDWLLEAGADFQRKDDFGNTALDWAREKGQNDEDKDYLKVRMLLIKADLKMKKEQYRLQKKAKEYGIQNARFLKQRSPFEIG